MQIFKKYLKYPLYFFGFLFLIILLVPSSKKVEDQGVVANSTNEQYIDITTEVSDLVDVEADNSNLVNDVSVAETQTKIENKNQKDLYTVTRVVDGDTIDVSINGVTERIRMIGINTPETVDPRKQVECFGIEASNKAKSLLAGKRVYLEKDSSQGERDKYARLLRYIFLEDGTNFGLEMIREGYAYEYTYDLPYKYQAEFKLAQKQAEKNKKGLWGDKCDGITDLPAISTPHSTSNTNMTASESGSMCSIKGNINSKKEKIYHMLGCGSYNQTVIDETKGERWFCSEQEALEAGWRKALNCD